MLNPQNQGSFLNKEDDFDQTATAVNLTGCDREPIHIPGSIQPHGFMVSISEGGVLQYVSRNLESFRTGPARDFLGKHLQELLGKQEAAEVLKVLPSAEGKKYFNLTFSKGANKAALFDMVLHRYQENLILEMEPVSGQEPVAIDLEYLNESLQALQEASSPTKLAEIAARKLKEITGFNRVMVYHFKDDGSGEVIAEEKDKNLDSFLGLHYPSSDIPKQARALYLKNPYRFIPDVNYTPVEIYPAGQETGFSPLDLTMADLRSVSPVHIQYLKNMGVGASMSVSIVREGKLWGLFALHHTQPKYLAYRHKQLCLLLGRAFTMVLGEKEEAGHQKYRQKIREVQAVLVQQMSEAARFTEGLYQQDRTVRELINCGGCALLIGGEYQSLGQTPTEEQSRELAAWLQKNIQDVLFSTDRLPEIYSPAEAFRDQGSGILAIAISRVQQEYIIWFRPEQVRTVNWAGRPEKVEDREDGAMLLSPRKSFEIWSEQVKGTSEPWLPEEKEAARELRGTIVDLVLRLSGELKLRADILSRINHELDTSKNELDSFAYIASHDLKEPLRGIHQYASFVLEDYGSRLDAEGQEKLQTLMRLSKRMQQLIDSLLQFSRIGRIELNPEVTDLKKLIEEVLDIFDRRIKNENVTLEIEQEWPAICCDGLQVGQVFMNLISNSLKYNDKEKKHIQIGWRMAQENEAAPLGYVFFVSDNGIGIDPKFHKEIFKIFRRLHVRDAYGGGTGAGLTISKKIVERHGGQMWVESQAGAGSTFCFSL